MKLLVAAMVFGTGCGSVDTPTTDASTPTVTHDLSVTKTGTGEGSVTSSNSGIACGGTCSDEIAEGSTVSLSAAPDGTSVFVEWSGACTGAGTCDVTMDATKTVTAHFAGGAVLAFPADDDPRVVVDGPEFNLDGEYVSGTRTGTGIARATHASIHLVLVNNTLTGAACTGVQKTQDVAVNLRQVGGPSANLGIMKISAGQTAVDVEFPFALLTGPNFSIEYITNVSVAAGCGGANYSNTGSTITLSDR